MAELVPKDLITQLCTTINIVDYLQTNPDYKNNWQERLENVQELINVAAEYSNIEDLLSQAALYAIDEESEKVDAVNMMTMHSSKGLEFKACIIVGCNEGSSPHLKSLGNTKQL